MKFFFAALLATLSLSTFAQSYLIMDNGITITIDQGGFAYDFGNYAFPQKITLKGGQYYVEDNNIIATIDQNGALFRKYELMPTKIIGGGTNYFLSDTGELYTIDAQGSVNLVVDEKFKTANAFGGNFFTVMVDPEKKIMDLYTVNSAGKAVKAELGAFRMKDVVSIGGTYFMSNRGVVYTVSNEGIVTPWPSMRVGVLQKKGANFFTDSSGMIYTVTQSGTLIIPALPVNFKLNAVTKLGSNYMLDLSGRLFTVDKDGNIFERIMRDHDFRNARVLSL